MKRTINPKPPAHLTVEARAWWKRLTAEYIFDTPDSILLLEGVMEAYDRAEAARRQIAKEGATIKDRFDQLKQHPAVAIERDCRGLMLRSLRALGLDIVAPGAIGRPAGR